MGIHGGRRFLINARFAACRWELIARRGVPNPAPNQPYFGRCAIQFLLKSAGGCRLVIQLTQWCTSTSVMFFSPLAPSILILLPTTTPRGGTHVFRCKLFVKTDEERTAGREVLFGDFVVAEVWRGLRERADCQRFGFSLILCSGLQLFPLSCAIKNLGFTSCATLRHVSWNKG